MRTSFPVIDVLSLLGWMYLDPRNGGLPNVASGGILLNSRCQIPAAESIGYLIYGKSSCALPIHARFALFRRMKRKILACEFYSAAWVEGSNL
jgi:hypothetical protein